jgi:hypothetical protein
VARRDIGTLPRSITLEYAEVLMIPLLEQYSRGVGIVPVAQIIPPNLTGVLVQASSGCFGSTRLGFRKGQVQVMTRKVAVLEQPTWLSQANCQITSFILARHARDC